VLGDAERPGGGGRVGHGPPPAAARQLLEVGPQRPLPTCPAPVSTIARTSTEQSLAAGMATAHLSASSRSGQSMIAYPPTCSRSSAAGPSVSSGCPSRTRTVVAAETAVSGAQSTSTPASAMACTAAVYSRSMACAAGVPGSGSASVPRFSHRQYFLTWFLPRWPVRLPLLVERAAR